METRHDDWQNPKDPDVGAASAADGLSFDRAIHPSPLSVSSLALSLPAAVCDRGSCKAYLESEVPAMIMQVLGTFQEGTSKIPGLSDEEREKRELTVRLAIDETLTNAVHYGLLGVTSEERVRAFMFDEDEPELNRIIDQKITSAVAARRRGSIEIAVFPDRVDLTLHDGTPFADFKTRWAECHRSADEEGVERLSGRGLHLLQSFGFQAHQAESGAVTYSLSYAALKA